MPEPIPMARRLPRFVEPTGPDPAPILAIHGDHDGFVPFMRKRADGELEPLCNVRATDLARVFPDSLAGLLDADGFYGINGVFAGGRGGSALVPGQPSAWWGTERLRWLTACWVDLDCYRLGMTPGAAIGRIIDLQDAGDVPPASMLTRSGRGVWAFWFLRAEDGDGPVRAWPAAIRLHQRVQDRLVSIFGVVGVDGGSGDAARITRVPGSVNRAADVRVCYWFQADSRGQPFTYGLNDLGAWLGVSAGPDKAAGRTPADDAAAARGRAGRRALCEKRYRRLLQLIELRGAIHEGCRNRAALLLGMFLRGMGKGDADVAAELGWFRERCEPVLSLAETRAACGASGRYNRITDARIALWLSLTRAEADATGWPKAGEAWSPESKGRRELRAARRYVLRGLCPAGKDPPPLLRLREALDEVGLKASAETIRADLRAIGVENVRARRAA